MFTYAESQSPAGGTAGGHAETGAPLKARSTSGGGRRLPGCAPPPAIALPNFPFVRYGNWLRELPCRLGF